MSKFIRERATKVHGASVKKEDFIRDFRRPTEKLKDWLFEDAFNVILVIVVLMFLSFFVSSFFLYITPLLIIIISENLIYVNSRSPMPYRYPIHKDSDKPDYGQPKPSSKDKAHFKRTGTIYLGNDKITNEQVWVSQVDLLTHSLYLGTTGAGKTEALIGLNANMMSTGSGLIYVDAKAAPSLYVQLSAIARRLGREDDLLVINYLTGNETVSALSSGVNRHAKKLTNNNNPFTKGSADSLVQLLKSFMPSGDSGNEYFSNKAEAFIQVIVYAIHDLRENHGLNMTADVIKKYMSIGAIYDLSQNKLLSEKNQISLRNYLLGLPGYDESKKVTEQAAATLTQHGYSSSYFDLALASLQDAYGHIYWCSGGAVDFTDVVLNNRILVVLLPALEKSQGELKTLGTLNLFGIKNAVASGLGSKLEGSTDDVLHNLPSASGRTMCLNTNDEFGYMAVTGFAVVPAQARGLGLGVVFAGQDWSGFKRGDEGEAGQIWGNTRIKHFYALEDEETMQKVKSEFGAADVMVQKDMELGAGVNMSNTYNSTQNIGFDSIDRIDNIDLMQQLEGESHSSIRGRLLRIVGFYADVNVDKVFGHGIGESFLNLTVYVDNLIDAEFISMTGGKPAAILDLDDSSNLKQPPENPAFNNNKGRPSAMDTEVENVLRENDRKHAEFKKMQTQEGSRRERLSMNKRIEEIGLDGPMDKKMTDMETDGNILKESHEFDEPMPTTLKSTAPTSKPTTPMPKSTITTPTQNITSEKPLQDIAPQDIEKDEIKKAKDVGLKEVTGDKKDYSSKADSKADSNGDNSDSGDTDTKDNNSIAEKVVRGFSDVPDVVYSKPNANNIRVKQRREIDAKKAAAMDVLDQALSQI